MEDYWYFNYGIINIANAGKTYVASRVQQTIPPTGINNFDNTCLVVSDGTPYGDGYGYEAEYDLGKPIYINGNGRSVWIAFATKEIIATIRQEKIGREYTSDMTFTIKGIMLQEGELPTGYQAATKHLTNAIENGSTEVAGGLVMTNVLMLKNEHGKVMAGMSGLTGNSTTPENVLMWGGGTYQEAHHI